MNERATVAAGREDIQPCGHPQSAAIVDELGSVREEYLYCGECALLELAAEVRDAIAAGDEMWAGMMAERAVGVARKLGRWSL